MDAVGEKRPTPADLRPQLRLADQACVGPRVCRRWAAALAVTSLCWPNIQILSTDFLSRLAVPAVNIHRSFLPAFAGADLYSRAWSGG